MTIKLILLAFTGLIPLSIYAQKKNMFTISGFVTDSSNGEKMYSATIYDYKSKKGTITNRNGFYSLTLKQGIPVLLKVSYVGYSINERKFILSKDTTINISLSGSNEIDEVIIMAENPTKKSHGHQKITISELEKLPSFLGEKDVLKSLMTIPGVQQGNEGSSGIYVRGGSPDQNLILLDDVALYNAAHLFGFVSVFTPEALQSMDFYKGAFPSRFGGRLSSIIDVRLKNGNKNKPQTGITLGLLSSKIVHEGPLIKGKSSYLISARRTLLDLLVTGISKQAQKSNDEATNPGYSFYDTNAKVNFEINPENHINVSFYNGWDKFFVNYRSKTNTLMLEQFERNEIAFNWGNSIAAIRWNSKISPKLFMNFTASWNLFYYSIYGKFYGWLKDKKREFENDFSIDYNSNLNSAGLKSDFEYYFTPLVQLEFGAFANRNHYLPGKQQIRRNDAGKSYSSGTLHTWEYGIYFDFHFPLTTQLKLNLGMRAAIYNVLNASFLSPEPRIALTFSSNNNGIWTLSYTQMSQPIHLLTSSNIGLPSDVWVPATPLLKPEHSRQFSAGVNSYKFKGIGLNMEFYYKKMEDVVSFAQGQGLMDIHENWENFVEQGKGKSWGVETSAYFTLGKFNVQLGHTLGWNYRQFKNINKGEWYPYKFDRRHKLDVRLICDLGNDWTWATDWTYQSGSPVSFTGIDYPGYPGNINYGWHDIFSGIELKNTDRIQLYPELYQTRLPAYHRLDFSFTKVWRTSHQIQQLSLGVFNVYSRQNPYFIYPELKDNGNTIYKQVSLFPFLPSISYQIRF